MNMEEIKRKWDLMSKEKRKAIIEKTITFFKEEREEEIGIVAAEKVLDFFLQNIGGDIYNKGIEDSKNLVKSHFESLDLDLDSLFNLE